MELYPDQPAGRRILETWKADCRLRQDRDNLYRATSKLAIQYVYADITTSGTPGTVGGGSSFSQFFVVNPASRTFNSQIGEQYYMSGPYNATVSGALETRYYYMSIVPVTSAECTIK